VNLVVLHCPEVLSLLTLLSDQLHRDLPIVRQVHAVPDCQPDQHYQSLHSRPALLADQPIQDLLCFQYFQAGRMIQYLQLNLE